VACLSAMGCVDLARGLQRGNTWRLDCWPWLVVNKLIDSASMDDFIAVPGYVVPAANLIVRLIHMIRLLVTLWLTRADVFWSHT
jgi:hypothetical protein